MPAMVITIDGPAGTGKSTVSRAVAERLGFNFLDTGAMYRAIGLAVQEDAGGFLGPVEFDAAVVGDERELAGAFEGDLAAEGGESDRAVHRAGVEEVKSQALGDRPRNRALAGPGGTVDRDDHRRTKAEG